jgi:hypothetical protein
MRPMLFEDGREEIKLKKRLNPNSAKNYLRTSNAARAKRLALRLSGEASPLNVQFELPNATLNRVRCMPLLFGSRPGAPKPVQPGGHSGFASSLFHRCQAAANFLTFSGCAAARFFFSPMSSARL